jgi:hypothetical protein
VLFSVAMAGNELSEIEKDNHTGPKYSAEQNCSRNRVHARQTPPSVFNHPRHTTIAPLEAPHHTQTTLRHTSMRASDKPKARCTAESGGIETVNSRTPRAQSLHVDELSDRHNPAFQVGET